MKNFLFLLSTILIISCNSNVPVISSQKAELEIMTFDVVEKNLVVQQNLPDHVQKLIAQWFDQKVLINGFEGDMTFTITKYSQEVSSVSDGKRVDLTLSFKVFLNKPSLSQTKLIEGDVSSYGILTGNFSLAEFDTTIQNTQTDLIVRLSRDLQSKI